GGLLGAPRLTHQKIGVGALARRILLNAAVSHRRGVEASLRICDEAMYAPHAALARTKRTPGIEEMSVFVVSVQFVRSLIRGPQNVVLAHVDGVNVHGRSRTHVPLVQELAILVELLHTTVVAVVDEDEVTLRIDGDSVNVVEITGASLIRLAAFLAPLEELLAILVVLNHTR